MPVTARELIEAWNEREDIETPTGGCVAPDSLLVRRVEQVLAECEGAYYEVSIPKEKILRILNGEE